MLKKISALLLLFFILSCTQDPIKNNTGTKEGTLSLPEIICNDEIGSDDYIEIKSKDYGVIIFYTLDESVPTLKNGIPYISKFNLPDDLEGDKVMIRARAFKTGFKDSSVAEKIVTLKKADDSNGNDEKPVPFLTGLEISEGAFDKTFSKTSYQYFVNLTNEYTSVKVKASAGSSQTVIKVNNTVVQNGAFSGDINLNVGKNDIVIFLSENDETAVYKIEVIRQSVNASSNNYLKSLSLDKGELNIPFAKDKYSYEAVFDYPVDKLKITALCEDDTASVRINGSKSPAEIAIDSNEFSVDVIVSAEDGSERKYTLVIKRVFVEIEAFLSSLSLGDVSFSPVFKSDVFKYNAETGFDTTSLTVTVSGDDNASDVMINNKSALSSKVFLNVGNNLISIIVKSATGGSTVYEVNVVRKEDNVYINNADLRSLEVTGFSFSPSFTKQGLVYNLEVEADVSSVVVNAVRDYEKASVYINDVKTESASINLVTGNNTAVVKVDAGDDCVKTYYIYINRKKADVKGQIVLHVYGYTHMHYWIVTETNSPAKYPNESSKWPGVLLDVKGDGWYGFTFENTTKANVLFNNNASGKTDDFVVSEGEYWYYEGKFLTYNPKDSTPPSVTLINPKNGDVLSNVVKLEADASDDTGVEKVVFYVNENVIAEVKSAPYIYNWDSGNAANGANVIKAVAFDKAGNSASSQFINVTAKNDNRPPVADAGSDITALKGSTVTFNGSKSYDPNGSIVSYVWSNGLTGVKPSKVYDAAGEYTVTLTVTDNDGATASDTMTVKIVEKMLHRDFRNETVYFMMTDRFVDGDKTNNNIWGDEYLPGGEATMYDYDESKTGKLTYYHGGDFKGIIDNLDYLEDMGFTAIWITPVVKQPEGRRFNNDKFPYEASAFHGYWGYDFDQIDPHLHSLGKDNDGWADFDKLVKALHARGMKLMLDIVVNHGQPGESVVGSKTKWADRWNHIIMDGKTWIFDKAQDPYVDPSNPLTGFFSYAGTGNTWLLDLIDFNANGPEDRNAMGHLKNVYKKFIDYGVDAFRIDTVAYMSRDHWENFTTAMYEHALSRGNEHFYMIGEAWTGDRAGKGNAIDLIYGDKGKHFHMLDMHNSSLDFPGWLGQVFKSGTGFEGGNVQKIFGPLGDQSGIYDPTYLGTFVDNHDVFRVNSILTQTQYMNNLNYIYLFRGVPIVYYGTEAMYSWEGAHATTNKDDVVARWMLGERGINHVKTHKPPMYKHIKMLNSLRRDSIVLRKGQQTNLRMQGGEAVIKREYDGQTAYIGMSINEASYSYTFTGISDGTYTMYTPDTANAKFNKTSVTVSGGSYTMNIPGNSFVIIQK